MESKLTKFDRQINFKIHSVSDQDDCILYQYQLDYRAYKVEKPVIGDTYHLSWANSKAMKWKLIGINSQGEALLETPKTKKKLVSKLTDLRHTSKRAEYIAKEKYKI